MSNVDDSDGGVLIFNILMWGWNIVDEWEVIISWVNINVLIFKLEFDVLFWVIMIGYEL